MPPSPLHIAVPAIALPFAIAILVSLERAPNENAAESVEEKATGTENTENLDLSYPKDTRKTDGSYRYMKEIHEMAVTGKSAIEAMGTQMKMPGWDDILVLGAQLNPMPLEEHAEVSSSKTYPQTLHLYTITFSPSLLYIYLDN